MSGMIANSYVGMVQSEVPHLIISRARRYRVGRDEIDDLQQQIVPLLAGFRFDPARANGASPATAMTAVVDRLREQAARLSALARALEDANVGNIVVDGHAMLMRGMNQIDNFADNASRAIREAKTANTVM